MSDQQLRELERRFQESGSTQDEAALLRARVQVGQLDELALSLAAWLGCEAAQASLEWNRSTPSADEWVGRLGEWGVEAPARAALALATATFRSWEASATDGYLATTRRDLGRRALEAAQVWVVEPSRGNAVEAREAANTLKQFGKIGPAKFKDDKAWFAPGLACRAVSGTSAASVAALAKRLMRVASQQLGEELARSTVLSALKPWALGYSDPLREESQD